MLENAYLALENGRVFKGRSFGTAIGEVTGEVVFTTGMTGYLETLSDPSYFGQIVVQTFPLIGNYGVISVDFESAGLQPKGYIVRECCDEPSNFRSEGCLHSLLAERGIPGICGIDTRALTRVIRETGVMNGVMTQDPASVDYKRLNDFKIENAVAHVSTAVVRTKTPDIIRYRVVLWDFGTKENIVRSLLARGCAVVQLPYGASAEEILAQQPDGVMLCNGPGNPADNVGVIEELKRLLPHAIPTFGICLGHQLLALAVGCRTAKLKYGHRGTNQPVRDVWNGRISITSQNHGYAVLAESVPTDVAEVRYVNANDGTCEGLDYRNFPAFSVQFHPEAAAGPLDTGFLFDRFIAMMAGKGC